MNLAFFGSRTLTGSVVKNVIITAVHDLKADVIVTAGEPSGVCEAAREIAKELSIPLKLHFLKSKERAAGKYHWRSVAVLRDCQHCVFIHDGKSVGTKNEMKLAKKMGVPYSYLVRKPIITDNELATAIDALKARM